MTDFAAAWAIAAELSVPDRLRLIDELAATMPDDQPPTLSAEWTEEIQRRSREIEDGTIITESWQSVRQRLFNSIGETDAG